MILPFGEGGGVADGRGYINNHLSFYRTRVKTNGFIDRFFLCQKEKALLRRKHPPAKETSFREKHAVPLFLIT